MSSSSIKRLQDKLATLKNDAIVLAGDLEIGGNRALALGRLVEEVHTTLNSIVCADQASRSLNTPLRAKQIWKKKGIDCSDSTYSCVKIINSLPAQRKATIKVTDVLGESRTLTVTWEFIYENFELYREQPI